jgi:hypothetical protein
MPDPAHVMLAAAVPGLVAVFCALLTVAAAEYLFEVGYRLIVLRTSLGAALRLEGPLRAMWGPILNVLFRRRPGAGSSSKRESGQKRP